MAATEGYASALGMASPHSSAMLNLLTHDRVLATYGRMEDWIEACQMFGLEERPPLAGKEISQGLGLPGVVEIDIEQIADGEGLWQEGELPDLIDDEQELIDAADEYLLDHGCDINGELIEDQDDSFEEDNEVVDEFDPETDELEEWAVVHFEASQYRRDERRRLRKRNHKDDADLECWKRYYRTQYRPSVIAAQSKAQVAKQWSFGTPYGWYGMFDRDEVERPETDGLEDVEAWIAWHTAGLPFDVLLEQEMLEFNEPFVDVSDDDDTVADDDDDDDDDDDWDRIDDDWDDRYADGLNNEWSIDDNSWEDDDPYGFWDEYDGWNEYDIRRSWGFGKGSGRQRLSLEYLQQKYSQDEDLREEIELEAIRVKVRESHDSYRLWQEEYGKDNQPWDSWKRYRRTQRWPVVHSVPKKESARHAKAIPISQADDFDDQLFNDLMEIEEAKEAQEKAA